MTWLKIESDIITRYINVTPTESRITTTQTTLDGTEYITRFGAPTKNYNVDALVDATGRAALLGAADLLTEVEIQCRYGRITGIIKELGDFEEKDLHWWQVSFVLSDNAEVSDR